MKDRIPGAPGQYSAVISEQELQKLQTGKPFAITLIRDDRPIQEGTPYSKAAVLPDDVAEALCPAVADPTPADAYRALTAKTESIQAELGSASQVSGLTEDHIDSLYYMVATGKYVKDTDCCTYRYPVSDADWGKTLKVRTYANGEMACCFKAADKQTLIAPGITNAAANIPENPASGVWEFEIIVPPNSGYLYVPFRSNGFTDIAVYEKKAVWDALRRLADGSITAQGMSGGWHYRKWANGFAECWTSVYLGPIAGDDTAYSEYISLPFDLGDAYAIGAPAGDVEYCPGLVSAYTDGSGIRLMLRKIFDDVTSTPVSLYVCGYWRFEV